MKMKEPNNSCIAKIYNHQYLWDNCQYPGVYEAFTDIWGTDKLYITIDRANLNLAMRAGERDQRFHPFRLWSRNQATKCARRIGTQRSYWRSYRRFTIRTRTLPYLLWGILVSSPSHKTAISSKLISVWFWGLKIKMNIYSNILMFKKSSPMASNTIRAVTRWRMAQYISMIPAEKNNKATLRQ